MTKTQVETLPTKTIPCPVCEGSGRRRTYNHATRELDLTDDPCRGKCKGSGEYEQPIAVPGAYILLSFGAGTQVFYCEDVTPRGVAVGIRYHQSEGAWWNTSKLKVNDVRVIGLAPANRIPSTPPPGATKEA